MRKVLIGIFVLVILTAGSAIAVKVYRQNISPTPQGVAAYGYGYGTCQRGGVGGCCRTPGQGQATDLEAVKKMAMDYYVKTYSDQDVTVQVKDFGCHQEAYVLKDGKQLKRLSINGNRVYEIG